MTTDPSRRPREPLQPADYGYDERRFGAPYDASGRFSGAQWPGPRRHDDEADWPTSPGIPVVPEATRPPSVRLTAIISFLFGPFGAAPASGAAHRAREVGAPSGRYWGAFLLGWLAHLLVLAVVMVVLLSGSLGTRSLPGAASPSASPSASAPATPSPTPSPVDVRVAGAGTYQLHLQLAGEDLTGDQVFVIG